MAKEAMDCTESMLSADEKRMLATLHESSCAHDVAVTILRIRSVKNEIVNNLMSFLLDHYGSRSVISENFGRSTASAELAHRRQPTADPLNSRRNEASSHVRQQLSPLSSQHHAIPPLTRNQWPETTSANHAQIRNQRPRDSPPPLRKPPSPVINNQWSQTTSTPLRNELPVLSILPLSGEGIVCHLKQELPLDDSEESSEDRWHHLAIEAPLANNSVNRPCQSEQPNVSLTEVQRERLDAYTAYQPGIRMGPPQLDLASALVAESSTNVGRAAHLEHRLQPARDLSTQVGSRATPAGVVEKRVVVQPALWPQGPERKRSWLLGRPGLGPRRRKLNHVLLAAGSVLDSRSNGVGDSGIGAPVYGSSKVAAGAAVAQEASRKPSEMQANNFAQKCIPPPATDDIAILGKTAGGSEILSGSSSLGAALMASAGASSFTCPMCGRHFNNKGNLVKHFKTVHLLLKPYKCTWCVRKFSTGWNLRLHERRCRARAPGAMDSSGGGDASSTCVTPL